MELHMDADGPYDLAYSEHDRDAVRAELHALRDTPAFKHDLGRLLRALQDIAERQAGAVGENVHLPSTPVPLHAVRVGRCVAYYAYVQRRRTPTIVLLGFYPRGTHLERVGTAAARLAAMR
jgi:hypothetical protein